MAIERINIGNFTVFKEADINFCNGINVIIGENGTGKTHLLKLLYAFCEEEYVAVTDYDKKNGKNTTYEDTVNSSAWFSQILRASFSVANTKYLLNNTVSEDSDIQNIYVTIVKDGHEYSNAFLDITDQRNLWPDVPAEKRIPTVFIPAKDMLTHAGLEKDYTQRNLPFDITLIDILNKAGVSTLKNLPDEMKKVMNGIERIIDGKVLFENNQYFILKNDGLKVSFGAEAEGFKKLGLIHRLIETGNITSGSVLIWDEPEANINPNNIPIVADILLALQENGVQIFIATHNYFLAKYINVRKTNRTKVLFHSLYKNNGVINHENENDFDLLENNVIMEQSVKLYKEEIAKVMK